MLVLVSCVNMCSKRCLWLVDRDLGSLGVHVHAHVQKQAFVTVLHLRQRGL